MPFGIHHSIIYVDIADSSSPIRNQNDKTLMADGLRKSLDNALQAAKITPVKVSDRGDGCIILTQAAVPKNLISHRFVSELAGQLLTHNEDHRPAAGIRLRMALHCGDVAITENTEVGEAVDFAARICDAREVKSQLRASQCVLAVVASDQFYRDGIRSTAAAEPASYRDVRFSGRNAQGVIWLRLLGTMAQATPRHPHGEELSVSPAVLTAGRGGHETRDTAERGNPTADRDRGFTGSAAPKPDSYPDDDVLRILRTVITRGSTRWSASRDRGPSAVMVFGPSGVGKTLTLATLRSELERKDQPHVLLDVEKLTTAGHCSTMAELVAHLDFALLRHGRTGWFYPRSILGALAASTNLGPDAERITELESATGLRTSLEDLARRLGITDPDAIIQRIVTRLAGPRWLKPQLRAGYAWYAEDRDHDEAVAALRNLNRAHRERRPEAGSTILAAFLADLNGLGSRPATVHPVIMIDNTEGDLGATFLHTLRDLRRRRDRNRLRDRGTFIATGQGALIDELKLPPRTVPRCRREIEQLRRGDWHTDGGFMALPLFGLRVRQVEAMTEHAGIPSEQGRWIGRIVHEATGGNHVACGLLISAAKARGATARTIDDLLKHVSDGQTDHPGGTVADILLARLLHLPRSANHGVDQLVNDLATCAAARSLAEAKLLGSLGLIHRDEALSDFYWSHVGPSGRREMHPFVRLLLLRRLAARPSGDRADWPAVFDGLAKSAKDKQDEKGQLYHLFAAGHVDDVAKHLTRRLNATKCNAQQWLARTEAAARCPSSPAQIPQHGGWDGDEIKSLLIAWRASNDVYLIDEWANHHSHVVFCLEGVARKVTQDHDAFRTEIQKHESEAHRWRNV